jgi:hypothetical protein
MAGKGNIHIIVAARLRAVTTIRQGRLPTMPGPSPNYRASPS